jgi:hypothetical protein
VTVTDQALFARKHLEVLFRFTASRIVVAAVKLGVFDALSAVGEADPETLAQSIGADADATARLLVVLEHFRLVSCSAGCYVNMPVTEDYLVSSSPEYWRGVIAGAELFAPFWMHLDVAVRHGRSVVEEVAGPGKTFWEYVYEEPRRARAFVAVMDEESRAAAEVIAAVVDWSGCAHFVELGAGPGTCSRTVQRAHRHVAVTLVDLPAVVPVIEEYLREVDPKNEAVLRGGDLFDPETIPANGDRYLLASVLHNWSREQGIKILEATLHAMPAGAELLVSELVTDENDRLGYGDLTNLNMLLYFAGREVARTEYETMLTDAGFIDIELLNLHGSRVLLRARKTSK